MACCLNMQTLLIMSEKKNTDKRKPGRKDETSLKGKGPKFSFNFYWIYGIILVVLIGTQVFNFSGTPKKVTWEEFNHSMLQTQDVEKIVVVNNQVANIYIKKDRLKLDKYTDV